MLVSSSWGAVEEDPVSPLKTGLNRQEKKPSPEDAAGFTRRETRRGGAPDHGPRAAAHGPKAPFPARPGEASPGLSPPRLTHQKRVGGVFSRGPRDPWDPHLVRDGPEGCNLSTVASWRHPGIEVTALPGGFPVCHPRPRRHAHTQLANRCSAGHR